MGKTIMAVLSVALIACIGVFIYAGDGRTPDAPKVRVIKLHNLAGQRIILYQVQRPDGHTDAFGDTEPFGVPDEYILGGSAGNRRFVNRPADAAVPIHERMTDKMITEFSRLAEAVSRVIDVEAQPWSDIRTDTPEEGLRKTSQNFIPLTEYVHRPIEP